MAGCKQQDISKHAPYEPLLGRPVADQARNGRWMYWCTAGLTERSPCAEVSSRHVLRAQAGERHSGVGAGERRYSPVMVTRSDSTRHSLSATAFAP